MWIQQQAAAENVFSLCENLELHQWTDCQTGEPISVQQGYCLSIFTEQFTFANLAAFVDNSQLTKFRIPVTRYGSYNKAMLQLYSEDNKLAPATQAWLTQQKLDYALTSLQTDLNQIGLIVSDMDSTFIQQEVIDEIGAEAGIKAEIAAITEQAMQGELDFSQSLRKRVSLLKGVAISRLAAIYQRLSLSPGVARLVTSCHQSDIKIALVSGGFSYFVEQFKSALDLYAVRANHLAVDEKQQLTGDVEGTIVDAEQKKLALQQYRAQLDLSGQQVLAMGDGSNDIELLKAAAVGVAYKAKPALSAHANVHIQHKGLDQVATLIGLELD